tara:strand:+ start:1289 stop:2257 length:969 start_codon:yes stop_codon:yes gene_type:complete
MYYVFTFIGEFGYELLNWQGTIRKWVKENKKKEDKIIVCSRKGLDLMYEMADYYVDISKLESMQNVVADCYWSYVFVDGTGPDLPRNEWKIQREGQHIDNIKQEVKNLVKGHLNNNVVKWIWSCDFQNIDNCAFGCPSPGGSVGGIYNVSHNQLDLNNNEYEKLSYAKNLQKEIENKLGFSLDEDYILCQTGFRKGYEGSQLRIDHGKIIDELKKECRVVLMDFDTQRLNDSYSKFNTDYESIKVNDIKEQSVLIHNAKRCVFFTEGNFRSHTYLPPMFGKDVEIVAVKELFSKPEAAVDFWNKNVFKFGGQMIAKHYEDLV